MFEGEQENTAERVKTDKGCPQRLVSGREGEGEGGGGGRRVS